MTFRLGCTAALVAAALLTACAEEETADTAPAAADREPATGAATEDAIEAQEQNTVELAGVRYRVKIFRQLNPRISPDEALYEGGEPEGDSGIYAAFLQACNVSDDARGLARVRLEDAFGEAYPRVETAGSSYEYDATTELRPDECVPSDDSAADRAFPGAAALFRIPFDRLGNRPFVLELRDSDAGRRRIELDV